MKIGRRRLVQAVGVAGLGLLAGCGRLPWQAQVPAKVPRVGYLMTLTEEQTRSSTDAFREGLRVLGYVEGESITIEYRFADGRENALAELAADLAALPIDVLVTSGVAVRYARLATSTIPIVMTNQSAPVEGGDVASLRRPGGNVTGLSQLGAQLVRKRLEFLLEVAPAIKRVAVLGAFRPELTSAEDAAQVLGVEIQPLTLRDPDGLVAAFQALATEHAEAVLLMPGPVTISNERRIAELALERRLASISDRRIFASAGGLMAYGPNFNDMFRRAAYYVDRILKGTNPADLPVEQPTTFDFIINLKTAQALGLTIPPHVLLQATEVLQ